MGHKVTVFTFVIRDLELGRLVGLEVCAPEVRYYSVKWRQQERIDRRFASPTQWRTLEQDLGPGLPAGPMPANGTLAAVLFRGDRRSRNVTMQYLSGTELLRVPVDDIAATLDRYLLAQMGPLADRT